MVSGNNGHSMMDGSLHGPRMVLQLTNGDVIALIYFTWIYFTLLDDNSDGATINENDALDEQTRGG